MDFTPLRRHRDYRLLYIAQSVSFLGTMLTYVALPYQMYQLTHSSFQVGLLGLAELIPLLLTAFIGGGPCRLRRSATHGDRHGRPSP